MQGGWEDAVITGGGSSDSLHTCTVKHEVEASPVPTTPHAAAISPTLRKTAGS